MREMNMSNKALVVLSGGMDSTTALRLAIEQYDEVEAITFYYKQKQNIEIEFAAETCAKLNIKHTVLPIPFLGDIAQGFSSNIVGSDINVPTNDDIIGNPQPVTYVPNRNMILLSIAASYAETRGITNVVCGFQASDTYGYHDCTVDYLETINNVLAQNRTHKITVTAPFVSLTKYDELVAVYELDGNLDLFKSTLTCYNPVDRKSCGNCPSCFDRLAAFAEFGQPDPVEYV